MNQDIKSEGAQVSDPEQLAEQAVADGEAAPTPDSVELLKQIKEHQDKYLYLYADFDNYKKRSIKERSEYIKFGHESLMRDLLQILDNLDRALAHSQNKDALVDGIKMVSEMFRSTLARFGVSPIVAIGQKFDPMMHEAVGQEQVSDEAVSEGQIIKEQQPGYTLHGRLLRPARVIIARKS